MEKPTVEEMEKVLGLDKIEPIRVTSGMEKELEEDANYFREWYEEELWKIYKQLYEEDNSY